MKATIALNIAPFPIQHEKTFITIDKNMINDSYLNITLNNDTRKLISMKLIE